jgi:hypothetical protein
MTRLACSGPIAALLCAATACASPPPRTAEPVAVSGDVTGRPLDDAALRVLLTDASVTPGAHGGLLDGPSEVFRANGSYRQSGGRAVLSEGVFEIRSDAVCIRGDGVAPRCRRVRANRGGTYTFIDATDGTSAIMTVTARGAGNMTGEPPAPLQDAALRALLVDAYVMPHGGGDDGPGEFFRANGIYQRGSGWGIIFEGRFEVRDGAVCVRGENSAPLCRRVLANADGSWTFTNIADGTSRVMTIPRRH